MAGPAFLRILLLLSVLCAASLAAGQAQSLPTLPLPSTAPVAQALSGGVRQEGLYWTAPIAVDGVPLVRIATPANAGSDQTTVIARQEVIQDQIAQILASPPGKENAGTVYDPQTLVVGSRAGGDYALLTVTDAHHSQPLALLTITSIDGKYQKQPVITLGELWSEKFQAALRAALLKRQPAQVERNLGQLWRVALALVGLTLAVWLSLLLIGARTKALRAKIDDGRKSEADAVADPEHPDASSRRRRFMGLAIRTSGSEMRLRMWQALSGMLLWGTALAWFLALLWALALFPETTQAAHLLRRRATLLAITIVGAAIAIRLADIAVSRAARAWGENAQIAPGEERARLLLRVPTIASATSAFATIVIVFFASLIGMSTIGIPTGQVLTFGGIAALGVTFAAQSLLRDFLNGVFVLFEDQYVVGDYVIIDQWAGVVENMTLRCVQLRDSGGSLITIPHGQVTQVVNCSRNWSRVDYRIPIDAKSDVDRAIAVLRTTLNDLAAEERYSGWLLDPLELVGVDTISGTGIVLRASIKTAPLRQFELKREINRRVLDRFREAGIGLGVDSRTLPALSLNQGPS